VTVTAKGTVLSGLAITGTLQISASSVTVKNVQVTSGGNFGISLAHTTGVTIENSTISGQNPTAGRVSYAIDDVYGDSAGTIIKANNISRFRTAIQVSTGQVDSNYIHDPGFVAGDHTNGIYVNGGTQPLMIWNNTIFDSLGQTDAVNLDAGTPGPPRRSPTRPSRTTCSPAGPTPSTAAPPAAAPPPKSSSRTTGSASSTTPRAACTAPPTTSAPPEQPTSGP
jgi:Right handed beta helix region